MNKPAGKTAKKSAKKTVKKSVKKTAKKTIKKTVKKTAKSSATGMAKAAQVSDDSALARLRDRLRNSPSYKSAADNDPAFLAHPLTRGVRLQLDYYKPEVILRENRIGGGIVVFGSARTLDPAAAKRRLAAARAALAKKPRDAALRAEVTRLKGLATHGKYYEMAREFGRIVSRDGSKRTGPRLAIITGGGPGIMEAANRGAYDVNAPTVGFNIALPHEQLPNPYITPELCFDFHYFAIRKLHFVMRARALVAFPGGLGTLDELFEILTLVQTRKTRERPVVLVGKAFWNRVFNLDALVEEGMIDPRDKELFHFVESARDAWDYILEWYAKRGRPLLENPEDASRVPA